MRVYNGELVVTDRDTTGYNDTGETLFVGGTTRIGGKSYRIVAFERMERAFGGNRVYFKVKEL